MRIDASKEANIKNQIRIERTKNPLISLRGLRVALAKKNFTTSTGGPLDAVYISKLCKKIDAENLYQADHIQLNERLSATRERFQSSFIGLAKIAFWEWDYLEEGIQMPSPMERVAAFKTIMQMDLALLNAEMDAGVFQRHLGELGIKASDNIPVETLDEIAVTFKAQLRAGPEPVKFIDAVVTDTNIKDQQNTDLGKPVANTTPAKPIEPRPAEPGKVTELPGGTVTVRSGPIIE